MLGIRDPKVKSLLTFMTEYNKGGLYPNLMKGSPACVYGKCGKGRVILVSPHLESYEYEEAHEPFRNFFRLVSRKVKGKKEYKPTPKPEQKEINLVLELGNIS